MKRSGNLFPSRAFLSRFYCRQEKATTYTVPKQNYRQSALPTTKACYELSPIRLRPYWAHRKKEPPPRRPLIL